jgi:hypothetical protein
MVCFFTRPEFNSGLFIALGAPDFVVGIPVAKSCLRLQQAISEHQS